MMTFTALICGVIVGWNAKKVVDAPRKLLFWKR